MVATKTRSKVTREVVGMDNTGKYGVSEIHSADDLDKFVYDPRNRPIDWDHVQELIDSIMENNLLEDFPIVVEPNGARLIVLDGQHRLEAARLVEVPIYYKVSARMTMDDVSRINSSTQGWTNDNYLNRWLREGKPEYIRFNDFRDRFPIISQNFAIDFCMYGDSNMARRAFRNGTYICDNMESAERLGEMATSMQIYAEGFASHRSFLVALRRLVDLPRYNHDTMLKKLSYQSSRLVRCIDGETYLELLLSIYNYKSRGAPLTAE